jgi:hypothetical protein
VRLAALLATMTFAVPQAGAETIPLEKDGGNYLVPVLINSALTLKFVLDTGASDVAIPGDVVSTLIRTGTVATVDFVGTGIYVLADGSKLPSARFVVRELKVGDHVVRNVTASVAPVKGALLLGQSFLSKLPPWSIDYQKNALDIRSDAGTSQAQGALPSQAPHSGAERWVELKYSDETITYDLETVRMIQPGRFTVISTATHHPDVMRFRLKVLDTLRSYCSKPDGQYEPPSEIFLLGTPDMPIKKIEVTTKPVSGTARRFKNVVWRLPYQAMAIGAEENVGFFDCEGPNVDSIEKEYNESRADIMNGTTSKELYDCNNGVMGTFIHVEDPLSKAHTTTNIGGSFMTAYLRLCRAITGQYPFLPPDSK